MIVHFNGKNSENNQIATVFSQTAKNSTFVEKPILF